MFLLTLSNSCRYSNLKYSTFTNVATPKFPPKGVKVRGSGVRCRPKNNNNKKRAQQLCSMKRKTILLKRLGKNAKTLSTRRLKSLARGVGKKSEMIDRSRQNFARLWLNEGRLKKAPKVRPALNGRKWVRPLKNWFWVLFFLSPQNEPHMNFALLYSSPGKLSHLINRHLVEALHVNLRKAHKPQP